MKIDTSTLNIQPEKENVRARKVAQDFEAFFVNYMLNEMSKNIDMEGFGANSNGSKIFRSMYNEKVSQSIAEKGDMGIERLIYDKIKDKGGEYNSFFEKLRGAKFDKFNYTKEKESGLLSDKFSSMKENISTEQNSTTQTFDKKEYIKDVVDDASQKYGVKPSMIMAIIEAESGFDNKAKSPVGAKGLMQLMDSTATELGVKNVWSIRENIMGGTKYFSQLQKSLGEDTLALAAYNAGIGNVKKYGGIPPFKETENYVGKVIALEKKYNKDGI